MMPEELRAVIRFIEDVARKKDLGEVSKSLDALILRLPVAEHESGQFRPLPNFARWLWRGTLRLVGWTRSPLSGVRAALGPMILQYDRWPQWLYATACFAAATGFAVISGQILALKLWVAVPLPPIFSLLLIVLALLLFLIAAWLRQWSDPQKAQLDEVRQRIEKAEGRLMKLLSLQSQREQQTDLARLLSAPGTAIGAGHSSPRRGQIEEGQAPKSTGLRIDTSEPRNDGGVGEDGGLATQAEPTPPRKESK